MALYRFTSKLVLMTMAWIFFFAGQPVTAQYPVMPASMKNQKPVPSEGLKDDSGKQVSVQFRQNEIDSIAAALPEGKARQMFEKKIATEAKKDRSSSDESLKKGEKLTVLFFGGEKAISRVQDQIGSFFKVSVSSPDEWASPIRNLNQGKGLGHLMLTLFVLALLIFIGLAVEWLVRRVTGDLRRRILDTASLGRLQFLGRLVSHFFLDVLGIFVYILITFVLYAVFYDDGDPGFIIVSLSLLVSYYIRFAFLAANLVLSPTKSSLRIFPLQDGDAKFLYSWFTRIAVTMMVLGMISYIFKETGIRPGLFLMMYSLAGLSVPLLLTVMIWRCRTRVAGMIWSGGSAQDAEKTSLRAKISKTWHWFAILYVMGMGAFWTIRGLAEERGDLLPMLISLFLIPIFIGLIQWIDRLLNIASGLPSSSPGSPDENRPGTMGDRETEAARPEKTDDEETARKFDMQQHLPIMKRILRIFMAALMFFLILRLWGIDLPIGRIFTSTVLEILVVLLLGFAAWQFTKTSINNRLSEEMPDDEEEREEGGAGGSRIGTLLVLLRKFVLSVLFVLISLIILSSVGVEIGPLIAGAGVIGLAIGFGSQALVKDILSGVFFLVDDAFRVGDYIESGGAKGMVEQISLRSLKIRHPRGPVFTIPFGDIGSVQNFSRDYIITKLDVRVRYDTDTDKIRKIVKKINKELTKNEEIGPKLLSKIKSQGIREMNDSAMILRVKYKTRPGDQFIVRKELYRRIQETFRENGIEFAHRNVTVYLPPETVGKGFAEKQVEGELPNDMMEQKLIEAGAAATVLATGSDDKEKI